MPDSENRTNRNDAEEKTQGTFSLDDVSSIARFDGKQHARIIYPYLRSSDDIEKVAAKMEPDKVFLTEEPAKASEGTKQTVKTLYFMGFLSGYRDEVDRLNEEAVKAGKEPVNVPFRNPMYYTKEPTSRKLIIDRGISESKDEVKTLYPHVFRSRKEIEEYAEGKAKKILERHACDDEEEYERLYTTGYVTGYLEELEELDQKAGNKPTITVTRVERRANEYVYYLELVDPGYIEGVYKPEPLTIVF